MIAAHSDDAPPPCGIGAGTLIDTSEGHVPIDWLVAGDKIMTRDHGYQPLLWIGQIDPVELPMPCVKIKTNAVGEGLPNYATTVTANQHIILRGPKIELHFATNEAFASADQMSVWHGLARIAPGETPALFGLLFARYEVISANGLWLGSMPGAFCNVRALSARCTQRLRNIRPEVEDDMTTARLCLRDHEVAMLAQPKKRLSQRAA